MTADIIIPILIIAVLVSGLVKKRDIVSDFCEGAREGLLTAAELCPMLILLVTVITLFSGSGAAESFSRLIAPIAEKIGFPPECTSLLLMRPISGSGSLAVLDNILAENPPDSFAARTASVIMCAAETTLYTITVFFSSVNVKPKAGFFAASFIADIACFVGAPLFVRVFLGS
ncbi:MAG: spore maturation protein [Ruminococcus sp.]|nr:spore maturation protein [Ruminococcus sp.]